MAKYHPNTEEYVVSRVRALESLLLEKGLLRTETVDGVIARFEADVGPLVGARMVARAWRDPDYRALLLSDAGQAVTHFGLPVYPELRVVEDTDDMHNLIVCTLCSCYPWAVMGLPPVWYKMPPYRSRAVLEPRRLLAEMGWVIAEPREIRVWDSSAELRYMVLPLPPPGAASMSEDDLAVCITRDALIGVEPVRLLAAT